MKSTLILHSITRSVVYKVNNLSYIPAKYFSMAGLKAMQDRGRMQEGKIADITIFNPDTNKADRVGFKIDGDTKVRVYKSSGEAIDA